MIAPQPSGPGTYMNHSISAYDLVSQFLPKTTLVRIRLLYNHPCLASSRHFKASFTHKTLILLSPPSHSLQIKTYFKNYTMAQSKYPDKIFPIKSFVSDLPTNLFPPSLLPPSNGPTGGRLIIIGDVHGMRKSLEALLDKINFDKSRGDHLILTGDLTNKGPDSPGVVDLAMKLGASAVRGNHDNSVLRAAAQINDSRGKDSLLHPGDSNGSAGHENPEANLHGDTVKEPEISEKSPSPATHSTAVALSKHQLDWLASLPLILRVTIPQHLPSSLGHTLLIAHAGLVPNIPPQEQDPHAVMHMRSLVRSPDEDRLTPAETHGDESWIVEWDRWQDGLTAKTTVVFGHDAKRRLQLGRYAIGLDSGCLYGNQLSALVIGVTSGKVESRVVQVECVDVPVAPTG